ncbi:hypothetical protein [Leptospirillum ferriphilum]|uniref:hypothetical protein n=1 Tax=Leptospirillum ferriphilum TaxID=178606 RepID=UPI0006B2126A|nr:hypothetical protein [Leptospirillum ferriphilum]
MAFKRSTLPKDVSEFIKGAEPVNNPDEVSGVKDSQEVFPDTVSVREVESNKLPLKFRVRSLDSFSKYDGEHQSHQVAIRLTERDREMLEYCLRIGEHRSKHSFVVDAVRKSMRELIQAQEE